MSNHPDYHLTLQQAAQLVGVSTKTLYRHMAAGTLSYQVGDNQRRYLSEHEVQKRFPAPQSGSLNTALAAIQQLQQDVLALTERLHIQEQRIEQVLALYQPRTMRELADKQAITRHL